MRKLILITASILFSELSGFGQIKFPTDPDSSVFVTNDIDNFWKAFDDFKKDTTKNTFGKEYIDIGGQGVKGFTPYRIQNAEHLFSTVKKMEAEYLKVRYNTLKIKEKEKQCRSTFYALKYWCPQAEFPPVYFVIGAFNSGGTSNSSGLYIGAEKQDDINNIPYIVAHELIHFQQKNWPNNPTLLQQSIMEGSADFIGEMISGVNTNKATNDYGNLHKYALCQEFVKIMNGGKYEDWLYGVTKKDDRPNDLGYWMGYHIVKQYFDKAPDKKKAIYEILNIKDFNDFLNKSGYLDAYLK
jgi:uncharacterized protein YjaZ